MSKRKTKGGRKWRPRVIVGGAQSPSVNPDDPNPVTSKFGHRLDEFVKNYLRAVPQLTADQALVVIMQFTAGLAVVRGCPEPDFVRLMGELYQSEQAARNRPKDGA